MAFEFSCLIHAVLARPSSTEVTVLRVLVPRDVLLAEITIVRDNLRAYSFFKEEDRLSAVKVNCFLANVDLIFVISEVSLRYEVLELVTYIY